jgi:hypothetical protein
MKSHKSLPETFFILTPEVREKLLTANLTAAEWRIWCYLVSLDPFGDRCFRFGNLLVLNFRQFKISPIRHAEILLGAKPLASFTLLGGVRIKIQKRRKTSVIISGSD